MNPRASITGDTMTVYKVVDMVGTSGTSVSDAIRGAVSRASETLEDLKWFEVKEIRGALKDSEVLEYQVKLQIGFTVHAHGNGASGNPVSHKTKGGSRAARSTAAQTAAKAGEHKRDDLARNIRKQP